MDTSNSKLNLYWALFVFANRIIQNPTLQAYFSRKVIRKTSGFGNVISRDWFELIMEFLQFRDNINKTLQNLSCSITSEW